MADINAIKTEIDAQITLASTDGKNVFVNRDKARKELDKIGKDPAKMTALMDDYTPDTDHQLLKVFKTFANNGVGTGPNKGQNFEVASEVIAKARDTEGNDILKVVGVAELKRAGLSDKGEAELFKLAFQENKKHQTYFETAPVDGPDGQNEFRQIATYIKNNPKAVTPQFDKRLDAAGKVVTDPKVEGYSIIGRLDIARDGQEGVMFKLTELVKAGANPDLLVKEGDPKTQYQVIRDKLQADGVAADTLKQLDEEVKAAKKGSPAGKKRVDAGEIVPEQFQQNFADLGTLSPTQVRTNKTAEIAANVRNTDSRHT